MNKSDIVHFITGLVRLVKVNVRFVNYAGYNFEIDEKLEIQILELKKYSSMTRRIKPQEREFT